MNSPPASLPDVKPVAMWIDQGTVVTQEFISRDALFLRATAAFRKLMDFPPGSDGETSLKGFKKSPDAGFQPRTRPVPGCSLR